MQCTTRSTVPETNETSSFVRKYYMKERRTMLSYSFCIRYTMTSLIIVIPWFPSPKISSNSNENIKLILLIPVQWVKGTKHVVHPDKGLQTKHFLEPNTTNVCDIPLPNFRFRRT